MIEADVENYRRQPRLAWLLANYRWYRRWCGGKWERWIIDWPVCGKVWFQVDQWTGKGPRPDQLARGTPLCEEWP